MSNTSHFPSLSASVPSPAGVPHRQRLRAVRPDEVPPAPDFLPPGATWLPAPGHVLPAPAGDVPMVGYLVLVPAERGLGPVAVAGPPDHAAAEVREPSAALAPALAGGAAPAPSSGSGPVRIDGERRVATVDGRPLDLTYLEFELLAHLVAHPHRVHSRRDLVASVWGYGYVGDGRTVDVHVARLRRKLGAGRRASIVTVRRVGYTYAPAAG
ncbi:winged helix-turn-helix domain-containing protein [Actinacidiphila yeochonensis]|uniref:winged helix-turn-helix domain-containing protein n=1 Tax=Actinacidiphila yeochonensis TaxID=89050 RepID=UPI00055E4E77|nr:winged helix-turn-helix domain-containing protein [Actinacidiphila yeochonensis]